MDHDHDVHEDHAHGPTWEMIDALKEALDTWEQVHSPLDDAGLHRYAMMRAGLNCLRDQLPPREP